MHLHMHMHPACNHTRSGFKNVTLLDGRQFAFAAYMADGNQKILIGYFTNAEEAALACAFATSNPRTFLYPAATHARVTVCHAVPHLCTDARSIGPEASHQLHRLTSVAAPRPVRGAIEVCHRSTGELRP